MPTLPELLQQLQFITQEATLLGLFLTAGFILVARDWRYLILALLIQYILVGLTMSRLVRPDIATLKVMIGAFVCPILFLSARRAATSISVNIQAELPPLRQRGRLPQLLYQGANLLWRTNARSDSAETGFLFRVCLVGLLILLALNLSDSLPLANLSTSVTTAIYWLGLAGLMVLALTEAPLKMGHGLLTFLTGFDLYYTTQESSLLLTGLWGSLILLIALSVGYLTVVNGIGVEETG